MRTTPTSEAVERLTAWIRNYGEQKQPQFIADLEAILAENKALQAKYDALLCVAEAAYKCRIEAEAKLKGLGCTTGS